MVSDLLKLLLLVFASVSVVSGSVCTPGKQFLSQELQKCINCTVCDGHKGYVVYRPCEVHRDTHCGPLSKLNLQLSQVSYVAHNHSKNSTCPRCRVLMYKFGEEVNFDRFS